MSGCLWSVMALIHLKYCSRRAQTIDSIYNKQTNLYQASIHQWTVDSTTNTLFDIFTYAGNYFQNPKKLFTRRPLIDIYSCSSHECNI